MIEKKEERSNQKIFLKPYWIVLLLAIVIFISEIIVMVLISLMPPLPVFQEALVDSLMLVALLSPALFFFLFKPIILEIKERKRLEDDVRKKEERNRLILESIPEMFFILNTDCVFTGFKAMKGLETLMPPEEFIGKKASDVLPTNLAEQTQKHIEMALTTETTQLFEYELPLKGILHNYEAKISRISADEALCIVRDITERKLAEEKIKKSLEEKEVLLREIHHRVKNNMQIVSSLLGLVSGTIHEKKYIEMFRESQNRINSMSLIHEKLYRSKDLTKIDFNEYIRDLANSLFKSRGITGTIELKINIENVSLGTDHAIPCGLIINELITNSIKYAFPGDRKGEIKISLHLNDENMNELIVSDNGVGIPEDVDFRKTESLGLRLVTILVENQLNGRIDLDRSNGTEFKIKFKRE